MKKMWLVAVMAAVCGAQAFAGEPETKPADNAQMTDQQKVGYLVGYNGAMQALTRGLPAEVVDVNGALKGFQDALAGKKPTITQEEISKAFEKLEPVIKELQAKKQKEEEAKAAVAGEKNRADGAKFLDENGKKEGVKTTASGLQYKIVKEGDGLNPKATDTVKVHYRGTLLSGEEFDSSYKRNEPAEFPLGNVIKGWTEGIQLVRKGGKIELYIPSNLAYGERGTPDGSIPPGSTLKFEVELLDIVPELKEAPLIPTK